MLQLSKLMRISGGLAVAFAAGALATPVAADVFAWRTEDGTYAFADDEDHVPARYADQARRISGGSLEGYARYTEQDAAASRTYAERLAARLAYLRELNAPVAVASPQSETRQATLSFSTGDEDAPRVEVPIDESSFEAPVVVEPVITKQWGDVRTRRATVVRRGDEVIAVVKGLRHVANPSEDIYDEDALEKGTDLP